MLEREILSGSASSCRRRRRRGIAVNDPASRSVRRLEAALREQCTDVSASACASASASASASRVLTPGAPEPRGHCSRHVVEILCSSQNLVQAIPFSLLLTSSKLVGGEGKVRMERVQYHLERLLPSLQLLSSLQLCSGVELQALTQQRRQHETQLITRGVTFPRYLDYIKLEEDFERLVQLRVARSGKDAQGNEVVTLKDRNKIRRYQERHILSIWQRCIAKLGPSDSDTFVLYLQWLQGRKMRRVYSEIAAQALSLHSNNTNLWIQVADWELNTNLDASAARLTLLRGIRLNTLVLSDTKRQAAARVKEGRRRKKARRMARDSDEELSSSGGEDDEGLEELRQAKASSSSSSGASQAPFSLPSKLTPASYQLLNLWLNYFRMECVFLERLRRRWAVLGINGSAKPNEPEARMEKTDEEGDSLDDDANVSSDEDGTANGKERNGAALRKVQEGNGEEQESTQANSAAQNTAPNKILAGALPLAIFSSALGIQQETTESVRSLSASPALPPELRFLFLTSVLRFLTSFPFANFDTNEGEGLRAALTSQVLDLVAAVPASVEVLPLLRATTQHISSASIRTRRLVVEEDEEGRPDEELEKSKNEELRLASQLLLERNPEETSAALLSRASTLEPVLSSPVTVHSSESSTTADRDLGATPFVALEQDLQQASPKKRTTRLATLVLRDVADDVRSTLSIASMLASSKTLADARVDLASAIRATLQGSFMEQDFLNGLRLVGVVWQSLAYQTKESDGDEEHGDTDDVLTAVSDPLLPYVAGVLDLTYKKARKSDSTERLSRIPALYLLLKGQAAMHAEALTKATDASDSVRALTKRWSVLESEAARALEEGDSLDPLLVYVRAWVWIRKWNFTRSQEEALPNVVAVLEEAQRFWSDLLSLGRKGKQHGGNIIVDLWRTCELLLRWIRSEADEGRAIFSYLTKDVVSATRRSLLTAASTSELSARDKAQSLHDEALLTLWDLCCEEREGAGSSSSSSSSIGHKGKGDVASPQDVVAVWRNPKVASPSFTAWYELATRISGSRNVAPTTQEAVFQHIEQLALSPSSAKIHEGDALTIFGALFHHYLSKGNVRAGLEMLHKAKRRGRGDEAWEKQVERLWERENQKLSLADSTAS